MQQPIVIEMRTEWHPEQIVPFMEGRIRELERLLREAQELSYEERLRRFGKDGVQALADELARLKWPA